MILELVDESRLLIILSPEDMEDYQLLFRDKFRKIRGFVRHPFFDRRDTDSDGSAVSLAGTGRGGYSRLRVGSLPGISGISGRSLRYSGCLPCSQPQEEKVADVTCQKVTGN